MAGAAGLLLVASCREVERVATDSPPPETPPYATLARTHNARIDRLYKVYARGVIELRWTDQEGKHFEQGDVDLWIALPDRTALNISKFGERLMWAGSRGGTSWIFDLRSDETVLYLGSGAPGSLAPGVGPLPIDPDMLLTLCGLTRLPPSQPEGLPPVRYDAQYDAWMGTVEKPRGMTRLFLDRRTLLPVRVEALSPEGRILLHSRLALSRYEGVRISGARPVTRPAFPTLVDVFATDDSGSMKIAVRSPSEEVEDRFFDLEWLKTRFPPERTEQVDGAALDKPHE
ncbi:MAG: hypothetical protein ACYS0G_12150 [Planctomycetota bacterium]